MSDLEFQRELSPEQIREALSLLDSTAGAQNQHFPTDDVRPAEEISPEPDQPSTTMAMQDWPPAAEDPKQRKKYLSLAAVYFGIAITAVGALALLSWGESARPPSRLGIAQEQPPKEPTVPPANRASSVLPVAGAPLGQSPGGSERQPSTEELAGLSRPIRDAANSDSAIPPGAPSATNQTIGTSQARWNERVSRKPQHTWWHARGVRVAAAKKRVWRSYWQVRADPEWCFLACRRANGEWCFFACRTWRAQPVFYEPPRNVTQ
jgi:hypothetical protein